MYLAVYERRVRRSRICRDCDRPIERNECARAVVFLEYTGGRRNMVWTEYTCCVPITRLPRVRRR